MTPAFAFLLLAVISTLNAGLYVVEGNAVMATVVATFALGTVVMAVIATRNNE